MINPKITVILGVNDLALKCAVYDVIGRECIYYGELQNQDGYEIQEYGYITIDETAAVLSDLMECEFGLPIKVDNIGNADSFYRLVHENQNIDSKFHVWSKNVPNSKRCTRRRCTKRTD